MRKPLCRIRTHRWEHVPGMDAQRCSRCHHTMSALDVIRSHRAYYWLAEVLGRGQKDRDILQRGWPRRGDLA